MKKALKGIGCALLVLVGIFAIALSANWHLTKILFHNLLPEKLKLDRSTDWAGGTTYADLQYSDVSESDTLNLYIPDTGADQKELLPLLILVHGGGFVTNDAHSRQAQFMYRYFRDQGFACASLNYRLAQEAAFPAALEDVKCAVRYLRANAEDYGIDPEKFAIWGESAGGYLCTMAAVTNDEEFNSLAYIGEEDTEGSVSASVSAVLNFYGAVEMGKQEEEYRLMGVPAWIRDLSMGWVNVNLKGQDEYHNVEEFWLRKHMSEMTEEEHNAMDPFYYMEKNLNSESDLSALIWYGGSDITVPPTSGEHMAYLLRGKLGSERVFYEMFPDYMHAADAYFSDDNLGKVKDWLNEVL